MIAYYPGCDDTRPHEHKCTCEYRISRERVEVMPDLQRMSRHDRRTMEAIARKYGIELRAHCDNLPHQPYRS